MRLSAVVISGLLFVGMFTLVTKAQTSTKGISEVFAEGKITGNEYRNEYFGLTLVAVNAEFTKGNVSPAGTRARLVDVEDNSKEWKDKYSIAVLADELSANPLVQSPAQYVRSIRHQLEREGLVTIQEESTIEISKLLFAHAAMKVTTEGQPHYEGIYTTFLHGYILSLQVEAPSLGRLNQIVLGMVKFNVPPPPAVVFHGNCTNQLPSYKQWFQQTRLRYGRPYFAPDERKRQMLHQYPKLKLQMSLSEVEKLLGEPDFSTPWPTPRLADKSESAKPKCRMQIAYVLKKDSDNMADMQDVAIYLSFSEDGKLYWASPQNLPNLKQMGSPTEGNATGVSN